jgi:glutathione S-transferase
VGPGDPPVLWHLKVSNYNEKARWALDHKRVAHTRRAVTPGAHVRVARRLTGGDTFPVLVLDGRAIGDSTRIIEALEHEQPERSLYPADPDLRRRALDLEEHFDEELGPYIRLIAVDAALGDPTLLFGMFTPDLRGWRLAFLRGAFPLLRGRLARGFATSPESVERAYAKIAAAGETLREHAGPGGYLAGDTFSVADLTLAALVAPAVAPPEFPYPQPQRGHPAFARLREALDAAGILRWAEDMYARHRGASAEIAP